MFWNDLKEFPGTPARICAGIVCELLYVLVILGGLMLGRMMPLDLVLGLGSVVLAFNGVTTWQYTAQRKTDYGYIERKAQGPSAVTVEAPSQVTVAAEPPSEAPTVAVLPLVSPVSPSDQPSPRQLVPLTHRESESD
jgi:hypothetical protein